MAQTNKFVGTLGAAGIALLALAGPASAGFFDRSEGGSIKDAPAAPEARQFAWSFNVGGYSDYVFRGISQTDEDPTIQGSIDFTYGLFYAGAWASGLDFTPAGNDANVEID